MWCSIDGKLERCNFFAQADKILSAMDDEFADKNKTDESFLDFLAHRFPGKDHQQAKQWATGYVSGFNAADPGLVSACWVVDSRRADEQIEGERAFHVAGGYQRSGKYFIERIGCSKVVVRRNTIVVGSVGRSGSVEIAHAINCGRAAFPLLVP